MNLQPNFHRFLVGLLAALFLLPVSVRAETLVIDTIGDSITAGFPWVEDGNGCRCGLIQPRLEALMSNSGNPAVVYNWGISGDYTWNMVGRLPAILQINKPQYVLINGGTNDLWWTSPYDVAGNISAMLDTVLGFGAAPVASTITPDTRPKAAGKQSITLTNSLIKSVAEQKDVALVDMYAATVGGWDSVPLHSGDHLHPGPAGAQVMANAWFVQLEAIIEAQIQARRARLAAINSTILPLLLDD